MWIIFHWYNLFHIKDDALIVLIRDFSAGYFNNISSCSQTRPGIA